MSGNDFMNEMSGFLEAGGNNEFMRPSSKLKLKKEPKEGKKPKKDKKEKKSKKSKKSRKSPEPSEWVDSTEVKAQTTESWMGVDEDMFGQIGKISSRKEDRAEEKQRKIDEKEKENAAGTHSRELNPFWKGGGSGLPPTEEEMKKEREKKSEESRRSPERKSEKSRHSRDSRTPPRKKSRDSRNEGSSRRRSPPRKVQKSAIDEDMDAMWAERAFEKDDELGIQAAPEKAKRIFNDPEEVKEERNKLVGKLMRANLKGDKKKAAKIQGQLDDLQEVIIVTKSDRQGRLRPDKAQREKDSDITALLRDEKNCDGGFASDMALMKATEKNMIRGGGLDELFEGTKTGVKRSKGNDEEKEQNKSRQMRKNLDNCKFCFSNKKMRDALVYEGQYVYVIVTGSIPMTDGHCILIPKEHYTNLPSSDETVASEMLNIRRKLTSMWALEDREPIFITTATKLGIYPHFITECVPIEISEAEFAPMFFQKAFQDAEGLWATNKAVVNTMKEQSHYRKIPEQLGHIAVEFGGGGGFAHVVENGENFPPYFMREIIGGLVDMAPGKWRKPPQDDIAEVIFRAEELSKKIKTFENTNPGS